MKVPFNSMVITSYRHCLMVFTPEQDSDKTHVEPVHSYDTFHTRFVLLWCENTISLYFNGTA